MISQDIRVMTIHPEGDINALTKFHSKTTNVNGGDRSSVRGFTKDFRILPLGTMNVPNFLTIHPVVVEKFQCAPKWWTDRQTNHYHTQSNATSAFSTVVA